MDTYNTICFLLVVALSCCGRSGGFWDSGTTTAPPLPDPTAIPRQSFFRWPKLSTITRNVFYRFFMAPIHISTMREQRKRMCGCIVGISYEFIPITTGTILNSRTILTAANALEPYITRMRDVRVWALGRAGGTFNTPYRYRVWRWRRLVPRSLNPEHQHGPYGRHSPRHDLAVIHTLDIMYITFFTPRGWQYAYKAVLVRKKETYEPTIQLIMAGSGFRDYQHIKENYFIDAHRVRAEMIVNCERYLPKWWGKFVCIRNVDGLAGVQNGGPLILGIHLMAIGCFEIRYNNERVFVFTDLRYYIDLLSLFANYTRGEYYEYAYSQWGNRNKFLFFGLSKKNEPFIPAKYYGLLSGYHEHTFY